MPHRECSSVGNPLWVAQRLPNREGEGDIMCTRDSTRLTKQCHFVSLTKKRLHHPHHLLSSTYLYLSNSGEVKVPFHSISGEVKVPFHSISGESDIFLECQLQG